MNKKRHEVTVLIFQMFTMIIATRGKAFEFIEMRNYQMGVQKLEELALMLINLKNAIEDSDKECECLKVTAVRTAYLQVKSRLEETSMLIERYSSMQARHQENFQDFGLNGTLN